MPVNSYSTAYTARRLCSARWCMIRASVPHAHLSLTHLSLNCSSRYVPMLVVRVSRLDQLCEVRTRRIEHLLDDFPDRILRLTIADVDLDPSSTLRLSRAVELHPATGLRTLRVVRSSLGNDGATLLATALSRNTGLRALCLAGNGITSRGCAIVVRALLRRAPPSGIGGRTLTELDLSDNPGIGDDGFRALLSALRVPGCPLQRLTARRIGLSPSAASELFAALGRNSRLVALSVGGNRLVDDRHAISSSTMGANSPDAERPCAGGGSTAFERLGESLIVNRTLRDLFVDDECGATVAECRQLARALRTNTALRRLRLDGNAAIGDAGAEILADGLRYNRGGIEELGLAGCSIGNRGLAAIVDATTRYNSTAKLVDLRRRPRPRNGASAPCPPPQRHHQYSGATRGVVLLASPSSDYSGWTSAAEICNNNTAERVEVISSAPSVGNGTTEKSLVGTSATPVCFDRQLVDLVEGLSRPRILLD